MMDTIDFVPWPAIHPRYNWAARDRDGRMFVFESRPARIDYGYGLGGHFKRIDTLTTAKPGTREWQHSLQSRHDWDKGYPDLDDTRRRLNEAYDAVKKGFENLSNTYGEMAEAIRDWDAMTRHPALGEHRCPSSFVDRIHSSEVRSGVFVEELGNGRSRVVVSAGDVPGGTPLNSIG